MVRGKYLMGTSKMGIFLLAVWAVTSAQNSKPLLSKLKDLIKSVLKSL